MASLVVVSTAGQGKVLRITSPASPPTDWHTAGFDDSAWSASVLQGGSVIGSPIEGSQWICETSGVRPVLEKFCHRLAFELPSSGQAASLQLWVDNFLDAVYLNGNLIFSDGEDNEGPTIDVGSQVVAGTNVLAVLVRNNTIFGIDQENELSLCYRLEVAYTPYSAWGAFRLRGW